MHRPLGCRSRDRQNGCIGEHGMFMGLVAVQEMGIGSHPASKPSGLVRSLRSPSRIRLPAVFLLHNLGGTNTAEIYPRRTETRIGHHVVAEPNSMSASKHRMRGTDVDC